MYNNSVTNRLLIGHGSYEVKKLTWLLLMHQIPANADSFRVKIWRSIQKSGALQIKSSVYVLPSGTPNRLVFGALVAEINTTGADAFLCESRFIKGISESEIVDKFNRDRTKKYFSLRKQLKEISEILSLSNPTENELMTVEHSIGKVERQFKEIQKLDFFDCPEAILVSKHLSKILTRISEVRSDVHPKKIIKRRKQIYQNRVWVTRSNIHVDRVASAWLIAKFIDKSPKFKFVENTNYKSQKNEICFDMFDAEFSHVGDKCTFEVLVESFSLERDAIWRIAEIIHDLDLKDTKFNRPETIGIGVVIASIVASESSDEARIKKGNTLFNDLLKNFQKFKDE